MYVSGVMCDREVTGLKTKEVSFKESGRLRVDIVSRNNC